MTTYTEINTILQVINGLNYNYEVVDPKDYEIPDTYKRKTDYLQQEVFNKYHTETELVRYMNRLAKKTIHYVMV